jgi:hypothetical protein
MREMLRKMTGFVTSTSDWYRPSNTQWTDRDSGARSSKLNGTRGGGSNRGKGLVKRASLSGEARTCQPYSRYISYRIGYIPYVWHAVTRQADGSVLVVSSFG